MRIEGELLKLGISVSATTIATVLRASGLGPAPRRIGPSWSDFLRAQAHSMIGEDRRTAMRGNALERDARKPSAPAQDAEPRELEADDNPSLGDAVEPRLASHPLPERKRSALPRVLPATRGPLRLRPSHRSHARDGPKSGPPPCSEPSALVRRQNYRRSRRGPCQPRVGCAREPPRILRPARWAQHREPPRATTRIQFLYPTGVSTGRWGDEVPWLAWVAGALTAGRAATLTLAANGGEIERADGRNRQGWSDPARALRQWPRCGT